MQSYKFESVERDPIEGLVARFSVKDTKTDRISTAYLGENRINEMLQSFEGRKVLGIIEISTQRNLETALGRIQEAKSIIQVEHTLSDIIPQP